MVLRWECARLDVSRLPRLPQRHLSIDMSRDDRGVFLWSHLWVSGVSIADVTTTTRLVAVLAPSRTY